MVSELRDRLSQRRIPDETEPDDLPDLNLSDVQFPVGLLTATKKEILTMAKTRETLTDVEHLRLEPELSRRINAHQARINARLPAGMRVKRADILRGLLRSALDREEEEEVATTGDRRAG